MLILGLIVAVWFLDDEIKPALDESLIAAAEAIRGRPATPVSYTGVARGSTVGARAPGVGITFGVGSSASGVDVAPGNQGGPVNRVGVR